MATTQPGFRGMATFGWEDRIARMRPGQREACRVTKERVLASHRATALVLPTRYGKSDVIRMIALGLHADGLVAASFALSPNDLLASQLASNVKLHAFLMRYQVTGLPAVRRVRQREARYTANGESLLSLTVQLASEQCDHFCAAIESLVTRTGKPVLVFIDEAHNFSQGNTWGDVARRFQAAGAHIVLLTATPYRADGIDVPEFEVEDIDEETVRYSVVRKDDELNLRFLDTYEGLKKLRKLKGHVNVGFKDAWNEGVLCKGSRITVDVNLSELRIGDAIDDEGATPRTAMLSELPKTEVRKCLRRVVRHPAVVRRHAALALQRLGFYRALDRRVAAIVFCGNDSDGEFNGHAEQIRNIFLGLNPELDVVIATSADGNEAREKIERFVGDEMRDGVGDILIVKQMAALGLDAPRLKIEVDLSTTRTPAAMVQRVARVLTPFGHIKHGEVIGPDEVIGGQLWQCFVTDQGGEMELVEAELVETRILEDDPADDEQRLWVAGDTEHGPFMDTARGEAEGRMQPAVIAMLGAFPELLSHMSEVEIADRIQCNPQMFSGEVTVVDPGIPVDLEQTIEDLYAEIKRVCDDITKRTYWAGHSTYAQSLWREVAREVWRRVYAAGGLGMEFTDIRQVTDVAALRSIYAAALRMLEAGRGRTSA